MEIKKASQVFGVTADVLPDSYVDRDQLDELVKRLLAEDQVHIALRGASKSGKSWLRKTVLKNPIVVQCRFGTTLADIYVDALSHLGVSLTVQKVAKESFKGTIKASSTLGAKLIASITGEVGAESVDASDTTTKAVGRDINDLRFIAELIRASGRRLVIEDFHYLAIPVRKHFSADLKSLWENKVNVVIVGVWSSDNLLFSLNPDLTGRLEEITVEWDEKDLARVLKRGGDALNVEFVEPLLGKLVEASFENAGLLQTLTARILRHAGIHETVKVKVLLSDEALLQQAASEYAAQLSALYQGFAKNVSAGIRRRKGSTAIYAHTMAIIMAESDDSLREGVHLNRLYELAHARQPRIQRGNLRTILEKLDRLQVDKEGRGLVITYNTATQSISIVDRQLLLYRRYATASWPWQEVLDAVDQEEGAYEADDEDDEDA